jgi:type I restriction enzyme M protein
MDKALQKIRERAIFSAVGLSSDSGHVVAQADAANSEVMFLENKRGTNYLLCGFASARNNVVEDSLRKALAHSPTVSVAILFDNKDAISKILRKSIRTGDVDYIASLEAPTLLASAFPLKPGDLKPLHARLENVLFEIHSAFRDIDGLHAPDALDEICKLVYAKLFDEENSLKSGSYAFQRSVYGSVEECAAEIRQLYLRAIDDDKAIFVNKIPTYDRSRGVFRDQLLLSSPAIVRAVELIQHFDFTNSPVDIKGRAFQNVLLPAVRSGMGQYFTPKEVIEFIVEIMRPNVRELIIDPFCGSGHFLTAALDYVRTVHRREDKQYHEFAFTRLHGVEKSDRMVRVAMTDMRLHGDGHSNIRCIDALLPFSNYPDLYRETFDLVMTNPPFGVDLPLDSLSQLGPFSLVAERRSSVSLEIVALERCLQLLRPGGRLAIVLPDGILSNRNTEYVRQWLGQHARLRGIISLPVETFSPFGANIKTSILVMRKLAAGERPSEEHQVFLSDVTNLGYDASGRMVQGNELHGVAKLFCEFVKREGW